LQANQIRPETGRWNRDIDGANIYVSLGEGYLGR